MGPSHNPLDHTNTAHAGAGNAHPLESFEQLVVPQPSQVLSGCGVVDTSSPNLAEFEPAVPSLSDSPDDMLAEAFPSIDPMQRTALQGAIEEFIFSIRDEVSRSSSPEHEAIFPLVRRMSILYGASRWSPEVGPIVWVECRCLETGCYVLPRLQNGLCGVAWNDSGEEMLPERFFEGAARVMLEFDAETREIVRCVPLVSPLCASEAERHLMVGLHAGELAESSYLMSQYHDLIIEQAIRRGEVSADATSLEWSDYLAERQDPQRIESSSDTTGSSSYTIVHGARAGRPSFTDIISLKEVTPWGLQVVDLTTVRP